MSEEAALAAVTVHPARILGLEKKLGTIEAGKLAELFVTRGSPLAPGVKVESFVSHGRLVKPEAE
jgi:imidazolonepropionase-like amidohydrolase